MPTDELRVGRPLIPGTPAFWLHHAIIWTVVKIMDPFWGTLNIRCRMIIGIQTGTIILTTTHMVLSNMCLSTFPPPDLAGALPSGRAATCMNLVAPRGFHKATCEPKMHTSVRDETRRRRATAH